MAYDVARVRGLHPSLGDGWVHFDAQNGMLLPDFVATTVSTAFRGSMTTTLGPHPSAQRSAAVLEAARYAVADLVNADPSGVVKRALGNLRAFDFKAAEMTVRTASDDVRVSLTLQGRERFGLFPPRVKEINIREMPLGFLARQFPAH